MSIGQILDIGFIASSAFYGYFSALMFRGEKIKHVLVVFFVVAATLVSLTWVHVKYFGFPASNLTVISLACLVMVASLVITFKCQQGKTGLNVES